MQRQKTNNLPQWKCWRCGKCWDAIILSMMTYLHEGWTVNDEGKNKLHSISIETPYTCPRHDDVIKWEHFSCNWPFVRGIHRSPVNSSHKGQWRGALMFSVSCAWINGWINNCESGDFRRHRTHYDLTVMRTQDSETETKWPPFCRRQFQTHFLVWN